MTDGPAFLMSPRMTGSRRDRNRSPSESWTAAIVRRLYTGPPARRRAQKPRAQPFDNTEVKHRTTQPKDVHMATESKTQTLPVLPLESGVILPQMVVTVALETPEARDAVGAAQRNGNVLLLLPRIDGRYA